MSRNRSALLVTALAVASLGVSTAWQQFSAQRIADAEQTLRAQALLSVLPVDSYDNQPLNQPLHLTDTRLPGSALLAGYLARKDGKASAVVLQSRTSGYGGPIDLMIAIAPQGRLIGVKVLQHNETPGLGAHIAEADNPMMAEFAGKDRRGTADERWALARDKGDFDQVAGATITSRAVVTAVHDALRYFDDHATALTSGGPHE
ncbi:RnfABCDGE type electron transport complex subunit G [Pseudomonas sp. R5(2019)]|nr:RnfABCDGE type electron transport complex subunit G [Pseudomonas sp. R5(2019)]